LVYEIYNHKEKDIIKYSIVSTSVSLLLFVSIVYYIENGKPFSCFENYSRIIATIFFYLSLFILFIVSYIEHYYWGKLGSELPSELFNMNYNYLDSINIQ
jgi:lipoprotein signal peptidase